MNQQNQPVTSREYKLALNVDRFADRVEGARRFWKLLAFLAPQAGFVVYCEQEKEMRRDTWYLETPGFELQRHGFNLRVRSELNENGKLGYKITLKYRNADRYVSTSQDVSCPKAKKKDFKFEEDILPPFISKFSHSASLEFNELPPLDTVSEAAKLFPGLAALDISPDTRLVTANDFIAHEVVRWIGQLVPDKTPIAPGTTPDFVVKLCLNFWYLIGKEDDELPLVAEFSFDYDALQKNADQSEALEQFPPELVTGASRLFLELQDHTSWVRSSSITKTAFALEAL
jgi:hypothetical protein